jgi:hypothetical protein
MDIIDIYRVLHPISTQYTFFSAAHGTFFKLHHILGHKASLSKYKKIEITPCIILDHSGIKLDLNHKKKPQKIFKQMETEQHPAE